MRATTLARTGPATVNLDTIEAPEAEPEQPDDVTVTFRGQRVPVSATAQVLPLVPVIPKKKA